MTELLAGLSEAIQRTRQAIRTYESMQRSAPSPALQRVIERVIARKHEQLRVLDELLKSARLPVGDPASEALTAALLQLSARDQQSIRSPSRAPAATEAAEAPRPSGAPMVSSEAQTAQRGEAPRILEWPAFPEKGV